MAAPAHVRIPAVVDVRSLTTAFESAIFNAVLLSVPVKLRFNVPLASLARANSPVPTVTAVGFHKEERADLIQYH